MYNTIRTLTALKHSVLAFKDGKTKSERGTLNWLKYDEHVAAFIRKNGNSEALVILNLGDQIQVNLSGITEGSYTQWLDSKTIANGVSQKNVKLTYNYSFNIDKRGYAVYVKN